MIQQGKLVMTVTRVLQLQTRQLLAQLAGIDGSMRLVKIRGRIAETQRKSESEREKQTFLKKKKSTSDTHYITRASNRTKLK